MPGGASVNSTLLLVQRVRRVVGGDRVDRAVGERRRGSAVAVARASAAAAPSSRWCRSRATASSVSVRWCGVDLGGDVDAALARAPDQLDRRRASRRARRAGARRSARASTRSRATCTSSAIAGLPGRPSRVETGALVHHAARRPACGPPRARSRARRRAVEYSSTRRITPLSMIVLPSSLNATAPARHERGHLGHHLAREALASPPRSGSTRTGESCRARSRM